MMPSAPIAAIQAWHDGLGGSVAAESAGFLEARLKEQGLVFDCNDIDDHAIMVF